MIISSSDSKLPEQLAYGWIKEKCNQENSNSIQLSTLGLPLPLACGSGEQKDSLPPLNANDVIAMKINAHMTLRQMFSILKDLRLKWGRCAVTSHLKDELKESRNYFEDLFTHENKKFEDKDGNEVIRPFIYCNDLTELIERICLLRDWHLTEVEINVGFDDGKHLLKQTLIIYNPTEIDTIETTSRSIRSDGICGGKKFKYTGVNKLLIIAVAPNVPETYNNCSTFISASKINSTIYTFTADLKMINICLGLMNHSSLHPCCYCVGTKGI